MYFSFFDPYIYCPSWASSKLPGQWANESFIITRLYVYNFDPGIEPIFAAQIEQHNRYHLEQIYGLDVGNTAMLNGIKSDEHTLLKEQAILMASCCQGNFDPFLLTL